MLEEHSRFFNANNINLLLYFDFRKDAPHFFSFHVRTTKDTYGTVYRYGFWEDLSSFLSSQLNIRITVSCFKTSCQNDGNESTSVKFHKL